MPMQCTNPFPLRAGKREIEGSNDFSSNHSYVIDRVIQVPCGKCLACRINKRREWTQRLMNEYYFSSSAYFITLTYDDEHLPRDENDNPAVSKRDVQLFMKRLRKNFPDCKCRFFIGSEYGPETLRPHYHGIVYNLPISFLDPSKYWKKGMSLISRDPETGSTSYINRVLNDIWQNGSTTIGEMSRERAGYCAKYFVDKKQVDPILEPVFNLMSRRPGIGFAYQEAIAPKVRHYGLHSMIADNGKYLALPRYYDKKIFSDEERKQRFEQLCMEMDQDDFGPDQLDLVILRQEQKDLIEANQYRAMTFKGKKSKL